MSKLVIFRDERNVQVQDATIDLAGGYTVDDLPLLLARQDKWSGKPDDFRVLWVSDATGDAAKDEAQFLLAHAAIWDADAAKLRGLVTNGVGPIAEDLQRDGIDEQWIREHYDAEAERCRARAIDIDLLKEEA